ncbi:hypothetical protein [Streptomyces sp. B1I3]|uniref:hypothetical protein n=1 Tax=Streptomyces sp. B1I3 TaxID=3042264 RepID=UPI0027D783EA|nr:hypothetical protein [Streptomyces sp. B1I3]
MSLLELIALADERGLAASALACLDRCLPLLTDGDAPEPLRPLWASCEDGQEWATRLKAVRQAVESVDITDGAAVQVRAMLAAAPSDFTAGPLREWADACSYVALDVHRQFDFPGAAVDGAGLLRRCRAGDPEGGGPLVTGELRRQAQILEVLAETSGTVGSGAGLLRVLDLSTEGRRVLRAVMTRRTRGQV